MTAIAFITAFALSLALTAALLPLLKKLKAKDFWKSKKPTKKDYLLVVEEKKCSYK